jgi:putative phage-type endonuclease
VIGMMWQEKIIGANPNQGTADWFDARCGHLTASRMKDVLARLKNGDPAKARRDYMIELIAERMTGDTMRHYVNAAMQHGIDTEPYALEAFKAQTGLDVVQCGFLTHGEIEYFGASPDGLIGDDWLLEIKCPTTTTHVQWMLDGVVPDEHKPQMLAQMACTGRAKAWFVSYDPRIKAETHRLFIKQFTPERSDIKAIEDEAVNFLAEVDVMFELVNSLPIRWMRLLPA